MRKFLVIGSLIVVLACGGGFYFAVQSARQQAELATGHGRLFYLAVCLLNYQERHGHLPRAVEGVPPFSWRVAILPEMDSLGDYQRYDLRQPWNSPHNLAMANQPSAGHAYSNYKEGVATYLAVVGPNTLWPAQGEVHVDESSDRILLVEWPESMIPWTEPRDLTVAEVEALVSAGHELRYISMSRKLGVLTKTSPRPW